MVTTNPNYSTTTGGSGVKNNAINAIYSGSTFTLEEMQMGVGYVA